MTKPKWDKNSYDKKKNINMGISIFAYMELQFQIPNSTTLSKKIDFWIIFRSLPDRSNMIKNSENWKKLIFEALV